MPLADNIYKLVGQNRLDEALELLNDVTQKHPKFKGEVALISGRLYSFKSRNAIGTLDNNEIVKEESCIRDSIISLVTRITPVVEILSERPVDRNNKTVWFAFQIYKLKVSFNADAILFLLLMLTAISTYFRYEAINVKTYTVASDNTPSNVSSYYLPPNANDSDTKFIIKNKDKKVKRDDVVIPQLRGHGGKKVLNRDVKFDNIGSVKKTLPDEVKEKCIGLSFVDLQNLRVNLELDTSYLNNVTLLNNIIIKQKRLLLTERIKQFQTENAFIGSVSNLEDCDYYTITSKHAFIYCNINLNSNVKYLNENRLSRQNNNYSNLAFVGHDNDVNVGKIELLDWSSVCTHSEDTVKAYLKYYRIGTNSILKPIEPLPILKVNTLIVVRNFQY